jgi:hypothetical protein
MQRSMANTRLNPPPNKRATKLLSYIQERAFSRAGRILGIPARTVNVPVREFSSTPIDCGHTAHSLQNHQRRGPSSHSIPLALQQHPNSP